MSDPLPLTNNLTLIRQRFINSEVMRDDDLEYLEELIEEYELPSTVVKDVARRYDWYSERQLTRDRFLGVYQAHLDEELEKKAIDMAVANAEMLAESVRLVQSRLPVLIARLDTRMPSMGDKELLTYMKLLLDEKNRLAKYVSDEEGADRTRRDHNDQFDKLLAVMAKAIGSDLMHILESKEVIHVDQRSDIVEERQNVFRVLEARGSGKTD